MSRKAFAASDAEWAYHGGELVKMGEIRLSPATHALNYGTGVFEGIRAYWNERRGTLQVLKLREHYERFEKSSRMLRIDLGHTVDEAQRAGYDDAFFLPQDGPVSEASAANIFLMRKGGLTTPPVTADILEGITRDAVMELAQRELDMPVALRDVDRTELYAADEVFLTGTGYQIAPIIEVDGRPVGNRKIGPLAGRLQELYFKAARGENPDYAYWTVAVEVAEKAAG